MTCIKAVGSEGEMAGRRKNVKMFALKVDYRH